MYLYLQPIETSLQNDGLVGRSPRYEIGAWNLFDFGHTSEIGLVATDAPILAPDRDILRVPHNSWSQTDRDRVGAYLRDGGINDWQWVANAPDYRNAWQRLLGVTQVHQSAIDDPHTRPEWHDPSIWMGRVVHMGRGRKLLPLDLQAYEREQAELRKRVIPYLRVMWKREKPKTDWREVLRGVARMPLSIIMGALPATYDFTNGGADASISSLSSNFTDVNGEINATGTGNFGWSWTVSTLCAVRWNADTFDNDQYSQVVLSNLPNTYQEGAGVRMQSTGTDFMYYMGCNQATWNDRLGKFISGSNTNLATQASNVLVNSDVLRLEASGTTYTPLINGSGTGTPGAQTDSSLSSGYAGPQGNGNGASSGSGVVHMDDWEGGNLGGAANLTVADGASVSQVDAVALTQAHNITVPDGFSTTQVDALALAQVHNLIVQDASVDAQADSATLTGAHNLQVDDGFSTTQSDSAALTGVHNIIVADGFSTTQADAVTVTQAQVIAVDNAFVTTQSDAIVLTQAHNLSIDDGASTTQADNATLTGVHNIAVNNGYVTTQVDATTVTTAGDLVIQNASVTTQVDAFGLTGAHNVVVQDTSVQATLDTFNITQDHSLTIANLFVTTQVDAPFVSVVYWLIPADASVVAQVDAFGITQAHNLSVADASALPVVDIVGSISSSVFDFSNTSVTIGVARSASAGDPNSVSVSGVNSVSLE